MWNSQTDVEIVRDDFGDVLLFEFEKHARRYAKDNVESSWNTKVVEL